MQFIYAIYQYLEQQERIKIQLLNKRHYSVILPRNLYIVEDIRLKMIMKSLEKVESKDPNQNGVNKNKQAKDIENAIQTFLVTKNTLHKLGIFYHWCKKCRRQGA